LSTTDNNESGARESGPSERALSLSYYTVAELEPVETVRVAAASGCRHVGLRLLHGQPGGGEANLLTRAGARRAMRAALAETGITLLDANTVRLVPETRVAAYLPFFETAAELGARHALVTADDPETGRLVDNLERLCAIAEAHALSLDFEFVPWLQLADIAQTAALIRQCAHPALGISVDALHYFRSRGTPAQIESLPRRWFRYAQICDVASPDPPDTRQAWIDEATRERLPPGEGVIDLVGLLRALPPGIPLALEIPQATLARSQPAEIRVANAVEATRRLLREVESD